jgi:hypothetical protein
VANISLSSSIKHERAMRAFFYKLRRLPAAERNNSIRLHCVARLCDRIQMMIGDFESEVRGEAVNRSRHRHRHEKHETTKYTKTFNLFREIRAFEIFVVA